MGESIVDHKRIKSLEEARSMRYQAAIKAEKKLENAKNELRSAWQYARTNFNALSREEMFMMGDKDEFEDVQDMILEEIELAIEHLDNALEHFGIESEMLEYLSNQ